MLLSIVLGRCPLVERSRGQVSLHLALVASEVRQHQEEAADEAGPERVGLRQAELELERIQSSHRAGGCAMPISTTANRRTKGMKGIWFRHAR